MGLLPEFAMTKVEWLVVFCIVAIVAALVVPLIDYAASEKVRIGSGTILQKSHVDSSSSTGVGMVSGGKSGASPVVVVSSTPEKWQAIVKCEGETFSVDIDANLWGNIEAGSSVDVFEYQGRLMTHRRVIESR